MHAFLLLTYYFVFYAHFLLQQAHIVFLKTENVCKYVYFAW